MYSKRLYKLKNQSNGAVLIMMLSCGAVSKPKPCPCGSLRQGGHHEHQRLMF